MGLDNRGVHRGSCTHCKCQDFSKQASSTRCSCGHAPTAHSDLTAGTVAGGHFDYHRKKSKDTTTGVGVYAGATPYQGHPQVQSSSSSFNHYQQPLSCYKCGSGYSADIGACPVCFPRGECQCGRNLRFCDPLYGIFQYCSPSCRDTYLLPTYNKKLQEDIDNSSATFSSTGFDYRSATFSENFSSSVPSASHSGASSPIAKQHTYAVRFPDRRSHVHFYSDVYSEDQKYGLYVTGLVLGEEASLHLADLLFTVGGQKFDKNTKYDAMISKYHTGKHGTVFRKYDLKSVCEKSNKEGRKCNAESQRIVFFLQKAQVYGIAFRELKDNEVMISSVDKELIAGFSGLQNGDIIQYVGSLYEDQLEQFEFKRVTKEKHVVTVLKEMSTVIGFVVIIERPKQPKYV